MADGADAFCRPDQPFFQTPFAKADVQNKAIEATNHYFTSVKGGQAARPDPHPLPHNIVTARNLSGADLARGEVLEFSEFALTTDLRPNELWYLGVAPTGNTRRRWGVALYPVKDDQYGDFLIAGTAVAKVNVTSNSHRFATPQIGETMLQSSAVGPVQLFHMPAGAVGEKECAIVIDAPRVLKGIATVTAAGLPACDLWAGPSADPTTLYNMPSMDSTNVLAPMEDADGRHEIYNASAGNTIYNPTPFHYENGYIGISSAQVHVRESNGYWLVERPRDWSPHAAFTTLTGGSTADFGTSGPQPFGRVAESTGGPVTITCPVLECMFRVTWHVNATFTFSPTKATWQVYSNLSFGGSGSGSTGTAPGHRTSGIIDRYTSVTASTVLVAGSPVNVLHSGVRIVHSGICICRLSEGNTLSLATSEAGYGAGSIAPSAVQYDLLIEPMF